MLYGCDYLPHALQGWLEEEDQLPHGKRRNFTMVEASTGKVCMFIPSDYRRFNSGNVTIPNAVRETC